MRIIIPLFSVVGAVLAVASLPASGTVRPGAHKPALQLTRAAAGSLVARHTAMPAGGWAWRSSIQAPHFQTDRDVGAASVGEGLLAAHAVTHDARYRRAAVSAGDYLLGVAEPAGGRLRWPPRGEPAGARAAAAYTRFAGGGAG